VAGGHPRGENREGAAAPSLQQSPGQGPSPWPGRALAATGRPEGGGESAPALAAGAGQGWLGHPKEKKEGAAAPSTAAHRGPGGPLAAPKAAGVVPAAVCPRRGAEERRSATEWRPDLAGGRRRRKKKRKEKKGKEKRKKEELAGVRGVSRRRRGGRRRRRRWPETGRKLGRRPRRKKKKRKGKRKGRKEVKEKKRKEKKKRKKKGDLMGM